MGCYFKTKTQTVNLKGRYSRKMTSTYSPRGKTDGRKLMNVQAVVTCFQILNSKWRNRVEYSLLLIIFVKEVALHIINVLDSNTFLFCEI
jgi:hypothetical protein